MTDFYLLIYTVGDITHNFTNNFTNKYFKLFGRILKKKKEYPNNLSKKSSDEYTDDIIYTL